MITRIFAVIALVGFAVGLGGELADNDSVAHGGEAAFAIFGGTAWIMAMCKLWKKRRDELAPKTSRDRTPLTVALAESAARSASRGKRKK